MEYSYKEMLLNWSLRKTTDTRKTTDKCNNVVEFEMLWWEKEALDKSISLWFHLYEVL